MAFVYKRGARYWCKVKGASGKWQARQTPFDVPNKSEAQAFADSLQRQVDALAATSGTVAEYAAVWFAERAKRGNASHLDDVGRITNHVLPAIGNMRMIDVRSRHIRDLVRKLNANTDLAPRTVRNIHGIMRTMFNDAVVDEWLTASPCTLKAGDLPDRVDADGEWRALAVYTHDEVRLLVSDSRIPVERRVLHAIKAFTGVRHGEAAGVRWRHLDVSTDVLARLLIATSYDKKRTKTNVTRRVPVHPMLRRILDLWRSSHWARVYGREATEDDLIVPARTMRPITANDAGRVFKRDLAELGLRVDAGEERDRGGHDLRSWHISSLLSAGAPLPMIEVWTHTKKADVMSNYTRIPWPVLCAEMLKLTFVVDGDPLVPCYDHGTRDASLRNRWSKQRVTDDKKRPRRDSNPLHGPSESTKGHSTTREVSEVVDRGGTSRTDTVHICIYGPALVGVAEDFVAPFTREAAGVVVYELEARAAGRRS